MDSVFIRIPNRVLEKRPSVGAEVWIFLRILHIMQNMQIPYTHNFKEKMNRKKKEKQPTKVP